MSAKDSFASLDAHANAGSDKPADSSVELCPLKQKVHLRLVVRDSDFSVYKNKKYQLVIGDEKFDGDTGESGMIDKLIPKMARSARLRVWLVEGQPPRSWHLQLGRLKPISTPDGVQARLSNLGFEPGAIDGTVGPKTQRALADFQADFGLDPTGELDGNTRSKLDSVYQSRDRQPPAKNTWQPRPGKPFKLSKNRSANPPVHRVGNK